LSAKVDFNKTNLKVNGVVKKLFDN
jgi:hypothetical protein